MQTLVVRQGQEVSQRTKILSCPVCNAGPGTFLMNLYDHCGSGEYPLHRCNSCEFHYLAEIPLLKDFEIHYGNESGENMRKTPAGWVQWLKKKKIDLELNWVLKRFDSKIRILDFGTGSGFVASHLAEKGRVVSAVDYFPSSQWTDSKVPYASGDLHGPSIHNLHLPAPVDVALLRHVLEHLVEPRLVIRYLSRQNVRYLWVAVPNYPTFFSRWFKTDWYHYDPPRHLSYFSRTQLKMLLEKEGYKIVDQRFTGIDEFFTSIYRRRKSQGKNDLWLRLMAPQGPLSVLASALFYFFSYPSVIEVIAEISPPAESVQ